MKYSVELDMSVGTSHSLILSRIQPNSKVLEFGTASGYMTKYMHEVLNCEVYGVELDQEAATYAEAYTKKMIVGDIEEQKWYELLKTEQFDYILFADVLEHLRNPDEILKLVVSLLKDDGNIITSVPNISHNAIIMELMQGKFDYQPTGLLDNTHVKFFTRKNVLKMLEYAGLAPEEWLVTQRKPETTEFKQDYRYFPKEVSEYLKSRPDGDVYQFITVSAKKTVDSNDAVFEHTHTNYLDADFIQIFWGSRASFSEENSIRKSHQLSNENVSYILDFPQGVQGEIRIDLSSELTCGEIHDIQIYSRNKKNIVYSWDKQLSSLSCYNLTCTQHNNYVEFITRNTDPQVIINDFELPRDDESWCIELQMKIKSDVTELLHYIIQHNDSYKTNIQHEQTINVEKSRYIESLEAKLADTELQLSRYENKFNELFEVIQRQYSENKEGVKQLISHFATVSDKTDAMSKMLQENQSRIYENHMQLLNINQRVNRPNIIRRVIRKIARR